MSINSKLKSLLLEAGLSESEVFVYLELIKSPSQNVWELVGRTGLSKSVVYRAVDHLVSLRMAERQNDKSIRALSLKSFIADLKSSQRKVGRLAYKIKEIAPYLSAPKDSIEVFEQLYTPDQFFEAYHFMAEHKYQTNYDFGDFESFVDKIGGLKNTFKFRDKRMKHAGHYALCTTFGPHTGYYSTPEAAKEFQTKVDRLNLDFKNRFIIFSDDSDYVLFNNSEEEDLGAVLIKSKLIADMQRRQLDAFSQLAGK